MDKMVEKLQELDAHNYQVLRSLCEDRWDKYHSLVHAAAFMVEPQFQMGSQDMDTEVADGWDIVLERLERDIAKQRIIRDQLADF
eukprot:c11798_g1_i1 orf=3-254(-)